MRYEVLNVSLPALFVPHKVRSHGGVGSSHYREFLDVSFIPNQSGVYSIEGCATDFVNASNVQAKEVVYPVTKAVRMRLGERTDITIAVESIPIIQDPMKRTSLLNEDGDSVLSDSSATLTLTLTAYRTRALWSGVRAVCCLKLEIQCQQS